MHPLPNQTRDSDKYGQQRRGLPFFQSAGTKAHKKMPVNPSDLSTWDLSKRKYLSGDQRSRAGTSTQPDLKVIASAANQKLQRSNNQLARQKLISPQENCYTGSVSITKIPQSQLASNKQQQNDVRSYSHTRAHHHTALILEKRQEDSLALKAADFSPIQIKRMPQDALGAVPTAAVYRSFEQHGINASAKNQPPQAGHGLDSLNNRS